jgi:predicted metal-binding membrane protein
MSLLFAFGVMNLLWVAGISAFVLLEKITPANGLVSRLVVFCSSAGRHGLLLARKVSAIA